MTNQDIDLGAVIAKYIELREKGKEIANLVAESQKDINKKMGVLEGFIKAKAKQEGVESFKTNYGTAIMTKKSYARVSDWDKTLDFILQTESFYMLKKDVTTASVLEYMEANKCIVPGVEFGSNIGVTVRKPTASQVAKQGENQ